MFPGLRGWVGVDFLWDEVYSRVTILDVNPRLTTSYIGLRALARCNLTAAMLQTTAGESIAPFIWDGGRMRFAADGKGQVTVKPG